MKDDPILAEYPEAKPGNGTPGYCYDFEDFTIAKNITGTGGWIVKIKKNNHVIDAHNVSDGIIKAREYVKLSK